MSMASRAAIAVAVFGSGAAFAQEIVLDTVVVTAQKREESVQKAALAITALSGQMLIERAISQPTDLNKMVPGLGIAQGGPSTQVYVRGVGNYATNAFADPAVAFNMDGVYISRFSGISGNFFDLERIEVLKGPQGTLYGRNATGGAINIVTKKPEFELSGGGGFGVGNYDLYKGDAYVNVPLSDTIAFRVSGQVTSRDGYQTDGYDDDESVAIRTHLLFEPSENTSLLLTGSYLELDGKGPVHVPRTNAGFVDPNNPWKGLSETLPGLLPVPPPAPLLYAGLDRTSGTLDVTVKSIAAEFNQHFGEMTFTLLANYMDNENPSNFFGPGFQVNSRTDSEQMSIEARLSGDMNFGNWVLGLYYFNEDQTENFWVDQGFLFNQTGIAIDKMDDKTFAAFGQASVNVSDQARVVGGLRYTHEKKTVDGDIFSREPQGFPCALNGLSTVFIGTVTQFIPQAAVNGAGMAYPFPYCQDVITGERSWNDVSWKGGVEYDLAEESLLYLTVSRGFKAGGFFGAGNASIQGNSFEPETLIAYALGAKNRFLDNKVQLNLEAFYWDYSDHQENYLAPTSTFGTYNFVTQRADGEIYGLDLELDAIVAERGQFSLKLQYLHARYTDAPFIIASPGPGNPAPRSACIATQNANTPSIWHTNCDGQQMPRSPTWSGVASYQHSFPIGNGGEVIAGGNVRYSSSYWSAVDYNPLQRQDSYAALGLNLGYHAENDRWSVVFYGENLTDEVIFTNAFMYPGTNSIANGGNGNIAMIQLDAPRTYGVRVRASF